MVKGRDGVNKGAYLTWLADKMLEKGVVEGINLDGGGTVALFLAAYGMDVVDAGPALLGMHSPFELSSVPDIWSAKLAYQAFFEAG